MKIRADEHVAVKLVRIIRDIFPIPEMDLSHSVEAGQRGETDENWITQFARDGGHAIVSADTDFHRKPHQVIAIQRTGLKIIYLPSQWTTARLHLQTAHMLLWWERAVQKLFECSPRECWQIPWSFSQTGDLIKVQMNFQNAEKKLKKSERKM